jgi:hypothetical protein
MGQVEMLGRKPHDPPFRWRSTSCGHLSQAAHAISVGSLDVEMKLYVYVFDPYYATAQRGTAAGLAAVIHFLVLLRLGLVPTVDSPVPCLLDVPLLRLPNTKVEII